MKDYAQFKDTADSLLKNIVGELRTLQFANYKRVAFYYLGAGEGLLLDRANPTWRQRYFKYKFFLDNCLNRD